MRIELGPASAGLSFTGPNAHPRGPSPYTPDMTDYLTEPCPDLHHMKGLPFPADVKFRHVLVTGPPGAGKTTLITKLGGWSEEGDLDLSQSRSLVIRVVLPAPGGPVTRTCRNLTSAGKGRPFMWCRSGHGSVR